MSFCVYYPRAVVGDGGATSTMWEWAVALQKEGHHVTVLADAVTPSVRHGIKVLGVRHLGVGRLRLPLGLRQHLTGSLLILHSGFVIGNAFAAMTARRNKTLYVVMPQGAYLARNRHRKRLLKRIWLPFERVLLERALGVHLSFQSEAGDVMTVARRANFITAPMGVEPTGTTWQGPGKYLAWFGRYDIFAKGIDLLLDAWARMPRESRPQLEMRGRDSLNSLSEIQGMIVALNLSDSVSAGGPIEGTEKTLFLLGSGGCVFPSRGESHSLALVEALTLGLPCVVTTTMPIHAELSKAGAAIVVEPRPATIQVGIDQMMVSPSAISLRAKHFVEEVLNWDRSTQSFILQVQRLMGASDGDESVAD